MRTRFAYLHVPKVAGTSVSRALETASDGSSRAPFVLDRSLFGSFDRFDEVRSPLVPTIWSPDGPALAQYDIVVGHFALSSLLTGFEPGEIAMNLREPRSRLLSHYSYWRSWTDADHQSWSPYDASLCGRDLEWPAFLGEASIAAQIDNVAVRMLVGPDPHIPPEGFIEPGHLDDLVARALALQRSLGHVDVIERGDPCWEGLGLWLGHPLAVGRDNETPRSEIADIDARWFDQDAARQRLHCLTAGDRVLWADAARANGLADVDALADEVWAAQVARVAGATGSVAPAPTGGLPLGGLRGLVGRWRVRR